MKKAILAFALLFIFPASAATAEKLNNESIVLLVRAGLGEDAILAKIKASAGEYDVSVDDLIRLKKANVPNKVIAAMIEITSTKSDMKPAARSAESRDPLLPRPPGVYVLTDRTTAAKMIAITPTTSRKTKSSGFWSYALTGGIASVSFKAIVQGVRSRTKLSQSKPIFYFYFAQNTNSTINTFDNSDQISIPDQFSLIRFDVKKLNREKKIGTYNITGVKSGLSEKDKIPFTYSLLAPGVYEVIPVFDLQVGEYGFIIDPSASWRSNISGIGGSNLKVFDFTVTPSNAP